MKVKKDLTIFTCDVCGQKIEIPESDAWLPRDWNESLGRDLCPECSKKTFLAAFNVADKKRWFVQPEDIEALAAGVPAEDIFV